MVYVKDEYLEKICSFSDLRLVEEIKALECMIYNDVIRNSMLIDDVILSYDFLRDECVERVFRYGQFLEYLKNYIK